jgi:hypothetical protein
MGKTGGLTMKASATWGFASKLGYTQSISASTNGSTGGVSVSNGGGGKTAGLVLGANAPSVAIGYTWNIPTGSHIPQKVTE